LGGQADFLQVVLLYDGPAGPCTQLLKIPAQRFIDFRCDSFGGEEVGQQAIFAIADDFLHRRRA
jgi:hypothetical protein